MIGDPQISPVGWWADNPRLTYREWLIGQALNGLCAASTISHDVGHINEIAVLSIQMADKVLGKL